MAAQTPAKASSDHKLHRVLGTPLLTFYGSGMILGAGIYSIVGKAAGVAGDSMWQSLLLAAFAAICTALSYAEMASMFPKVGGEYVYLKYSFPRQRWLASSSGLLMVFSGIATAATVALAFAGYLEQFVKVPNLPVAFALLAFFTGVNIVGVRESSWMNVVFTSIEATGLLIFAAIGANSPRFGEALAASPSLNTLSGASLVIFAYFGFENIVNFVEEAKEPQRTLPRAIVLSIGLSTILYLWVALSALALMPSEQLARSHAPLADALRGVSPRLAGALAGVALFATANTALISLASSSRILLGMGRDGAVPAFFGRLLKKRKTPWLAALACLGVACLLLPLGKIEVVASVSAFATLLAFIAVNVALIVLRYSSPRKERPFRSPLSFGQLPLLPLLGVLLSALLLLQFHWQVYAVGGTLVIFLLIFEIFVRRRIKIPATMKL